MRAIDPQVVLLLLAAVSAQAAVFTVTATLAESGFSLLAHLGLLAGLAVSLRNLKRCFPLDWLAGGIIVAALAVFTIRSSGSALASLFYPLSALSDQNLSMAVLLVWLLVAFSFLQYRRRNLIFISACGLALFGLIGVVNLEPGFLVAFLIYLFATIMVWSYDALTARAAEGPATMWWRVARSQASSGASVLVGVSLAGFLISSLLYFTIPSPFGPGMRVSPMWSWAGALVQGDFLLSSRLPVGAGPATLSEQVLFRVQAEAPGLWRTNVYDHYDGHSWARTITSAYRVPQVADNWFALPWTPRPGQRLNRQRFWVESTSSGAVLAAAHPVEVRFGPGPWHFRMSSLTMDHYGCLTSNPVSLPGMAYQVVSLVPEADPEKLRRAGTSYPPWLRRLYIEDLPLATESALSALVEQVVAGAQTPYDKAVAIQQFLEANCYYTEREPITPLGKDAAAYFLLESRRGACDLFATAMAVMLRLAEVPARVATGFVSGEHDPHTGTEVIRGKDAHAWVEVYFPGYGWVPFNPSPAESLEEQSLLDLLRKGQSWYVIGRIAKAVGVVALAAALVVLVFLAAVDPRLLRHRLLHFHAGRYPWEHAARECRAANAALLASLGLAARPGETPLEMLNRAAAHPGAAQAAGLPRLSRLTRTFYRLRYGPTPGSTQQAQRLAREFRTLRRRFRPPRR